MRKPTRALSGLCLAGTTLSVSACHYVSPVRDTGVAQYNRVSYSAHRSSAVRESEGSRGIPESQSDAMFKSGRQTKQMVGSLRVSLARLRNEQTLAADESPSVKTRSWLLGTMPEVSDEIGLYIARPTTEDAADDSAGELMGPFPEDREELTTRSNSEPPDAPAPHHLNAANGSGARTGNGGRHDTTPVNTLGGPNATEILGVVNLDLVSGRSASINVLTGLSISPHRLAGSSLRGAFGLNILGARPNPLSNGCAALIRANFRDFPVAFRGCQ